MHIVKRKREVFGFIGEKIHGKLQACCNKDLSRAGKLTLLKSAAQSTPNF